MLRVLTLLMPPFRWLRAIVESLHGARVHPTAVLLGRRSQIRLSKAVKIGHRSKLDPGLKGMIDVHTDVWVSSDVEMQTDTLLQIGGGTTIQRRCSINGTVRMGRGCILAPSVFISSGTHPFREIPFLPIREQERRLAADERLEALDRPVWVQDDCWVGTHAVICPGITIGKGSIIGANSVVTKDVQPYSVYAGSPASAIGERLDWQPPLLIDPLREEHHPYLLSARLELTADGYIMIASKTDPLLAALAASDLPFRIVVRWTAQSGFAWVFNGRFLRQEAGHGEIELPGDEVNVRGNVAYCALEVEPTDYSNPIVKVLSLSIEKG